MKQTSLKVMRLLMLNAAAVCLNGCVTNTPNLQDDRRAAAQSLQSSMSAEDRAQASRQVVVTFRDERAVLAMQAGATPVLQASKAGYKPSAYARRTVEGLAKDYQLVRVTDWYIETLGVHCVVYRATDDAARDALLVRLRSDRRVTDAQPMNEFRTLGTPDAKQPAATEAVSSTTSSAAERKDPYTSLQAATARIGVPEAQQHSLGRGVRIAIIDTGLDSQHTDLAGRIESTSNFVDQDAAQFRRDRHGTAVGGTIAANSGNGAGILGVAPLARLIILKACWEVDVSGSAVCNSLTLAGAIEAAIKQRVHIINLSLAGPADQLLSGLLQRAIERGIAVVGAAPAPGGQTNEGFPSNVPGVIPVVNSDATVDSASLREAAANLACLGAPGSEVLTLAPGGRYDFASGVSISTALVAGVTALLLERAPSSTARPGFVSGLRNLLYQTGSQRNFRAPEINAARALRAALKLSNP